MPRLRKGLTICLAPLMLALSTSPAHAISWLGDAYDVAGDAFWHYMWFAWDVGGTLGPGLHR